MPGTMRDSLPLQELLPDDFEVEGLVSADESDSFSFEPVSEDIFDDGPGSDCVERSRLLFASLKPHFGQPAIMPPSLNQYKVGNNELCYKMTTVALLAQGFAHSALQGAPLHYPPKSMAEPTTVTVSPSGTSPSASASTSARSRDATYGTGTILHRLCSQPAPFRSAIDRTLTLDPQAARRPSTLYARKAVWDPKTNKLKRKIVKKSYAYPVNLALANLTLTRKTIKKVMSLSEDILDKPDGRKQETSLMVLLKSRPYDTKLVDHVLLAAPKSVFHKDRHFNTALHVACQYGASLLAVRHLCILFPEATNMTNFHGFTPLEIAQRNGRCSESVVDFLMEQAQP